MTKARKKIAALAVASALGGGMMMSAPVQALNISQNNLGEVLYYPYYTVKNGMDTVFTVVNTTNRTAIIKIRFREALNSREVRDFDVVLSPYDHWGGVVTGDGANGALVRTFDRSCTSPILPASANATLAAAGGREVAFTNYGFTSDSAGNTNMTVRGPDGATTDISRVQEGYFEVFLMGLSANTTGSVTNAPFEYYAKHVKDATTGISAPRDCTKIDGYLGNAPGASISGTVFSAFSAPEDVLKGHVTYINVANGQAIDAEATAIEHWKDSSVAIYSSSDLNPNLANGDNPMSNGVATTMAGPSNAFSRNFSTAPSTAPNAVVNAATGAMSADAVINEFASGSGTATSWIITFPTKHYYTDYDLLAHAAGIPPFAENFAKRYDSSYPVAQQNTLNASATHYGMSCDTVSVGYWDREENMPGSSGTVFSPAPAGASSQLCYEVNVVDFNGSTIFGSGTNHLGLSTTSVGTSGWARIGLINTGNVGSVTSVTGLPAIGFATILRTAGGATVNYGSNEAHSFQSGNH